MIAVLCAHRNSNYYKIPGLDVYDQDRDSRTFPGNMPVIVHPPCAQWSKMKAFSHDNPEQKQLAYFCLDELKKWGGIFEHPHGSDVWKELDWPEGGKFIQVDQFWWGFPARKRTTLFFYRCKPIQYPLNFDAVQYTVALSRSNSKNLMATRLPEMKKSQRSITTLSFNQWLVDSILQTHN
jgi:hypothetical protein